MLPPHLASLHIYPLKSAGGIAVAEAEVDETGLAYDRRWLLVDAEGRFLSQRSHPRMALLRTALADGSLRVTAPDMDPLVLPLEPPRALPAHEMVPVWGEGRYAVACGGEAANWASEFLGVACRMVRAVSPRDLPRVDERGRVRASFADGFAALVVGNASLENLNYRLLEPLPMNRFRPNLVVGGITPYGEDRWERVRVGEVTLRGRKPCFRCAITTTDQETGKRDVEPLRTLVAYRRAPNGEVAFGMKVSFEGPGTLRVGDPVVEHVTSGI